VSLPLVGAFDGVAAYAAVVATGGLVWQIFTWRRSHWTRVLLEIETGAWPEDPDDEDPDYLSILAVKVLNRSHFPIRVMGASAGPAKVVNLDEQPLKLEGMPMVRNIVVPAYDAIDIFFDWQTLDYRLGKDRKVRVSVYLSTKTVKEYFSDHVGVWRRLGRGLRKRISDMRRRLTLR